MTWWVIEDEELRSILARVEQEELSALDAYALLIEDSRDEHVEGDA